MLTLVVLVVHVRMIAMNTMIMINHRFVRVSITPNAATNAPSQDGRAIAIIIIIIIITTIIIMISIIIIINNLFQGPRAAGFTRGRVPA